MTPLNFVKQFFEILFFKPFQSWFSYLFHKQISNPVKLTLSVRGTTVRLAYTQYKPN
jgi:hypothetical protein